IIGHLCMRNPCDCREHIVNLRKILGGLLGVFGKPCRDTGNMVVRGGVKRPDRAQGCFELCSKHNEAASEHSVLCQATKSSRVLDRHLAKVARHSYPSRIVVRRSINHLNEVLEQKLRSWKYLVIYHWGLTPELSRAAKRRRLERIVRAHFRDPGSWPHPGLSALKVAHQHAGQAPRYPEHAQSPCSGHSPGRWCVGGDATRFRRGSSLGRRDHPPRTWCYQICSA